MYLFLVRHGESEGNVAGRLQGWQDVALTPRGEHQAARTALALSTFLRQAGRPVAGLYSSPLQRARCTATAIGQELGCTPQIDPGLREMHFGHIEGLTNAEWKDRYPELLPGWHTPEDLDFGWPGGETRRVFHERIDMAIGSILARHRPADSLVVVTHGGVISTYLAYLTTGAWADWRHFSVENCSISQLTFEADSPTAPTVACLLRFNDTNHLQEAEITAVIGAD